MNWNPFRNPFINEPEATPRIIEIKPEHQMELRRLWDAYADSKENKKAAQYAFWVRSVEYYPEIKIGEWSIAWGGYDAHFEEDAE